MTNQKRFIFLRVKFVTNQLVEVTKREPNSQEMFRSLRKIDIAYSIVDTSLSRFTTPKIVSPFIVMVCE